MKTYRLFLTLFIFLELILTTVATAEEVEVLRVAAADAEMFPDESGQGGAVFYKDITPLTNPEKGYVMTAYNGFRFYFDIAEAGIYNIYLNGCSGNKISTNTGALAINQMHTDIPGPNANRYVMVFYCWFCEEVGEGAVRKFIEYEVAKDITLDAGLNYVTYDSWDPGTYSHQRIDALIVKKVVTSVDEISAPKSAITVNNGTVKITTIANENYSLMVYSITGAEVWKQENLSAATEVNGLIKGIYMFFVKSDLGLDTQKVVVK